MPEAEISLRLLTREVLAAYASIREVLGQLLTVDRVNESDALLWPSRRWQEAQLVKKFGIRIVTVGQDGRVDGLEFEDARPA
jgi:hypothetical protein